MVFVYHISFSLALLISLQQVNGNLEEDFINVHGNNEEPLEWPRGESMDMEVVKELCENMKTGRYVNASVVSYGKDIGYLLFDDPRYDSRQISVLFCKMRMETAQIKRDEYLYFTQGKETDGYFIVLDDSGDKMFKLADHKIVSLKPKDFVPAPVGVPKLPVQPKKSVSRVVKRPDMPRQRLPKKNYDNVTPVFKRTIWQVEE